MNWFVVAAVMAALYLGPFLYCLTKRRFNSAALMVGLVNVFLAFVNSVAPVRGWADPDYLGFSFGFLRVEPGPGVTLVAGTIVVLATFTACVAVLGRTGGLLRIAAVFNALVALNLGGAVLRDLVSRPETMKIQLGEYLTIGPVGATLIEVGVLALPLALAAVWAWRRSNSTDGGASHLQRASSPSPSPAA